MVAEMFSPVNFDPTGGVPNLNLFLNGFHPDDRQKLLSIQQWAIDNRKQASCVYRRTHRLVMNVTMRHHFIQSFDSTGQLLPHGGLCLTSPIDITARKNYAE